MSDLTPPVTIPRAFAGFGQRGPRLRRVKVETLTTTKKWWSGNRTEILVEGIGPGGGGGSSYLSTIGGGGGASGQAIFGKVRVQKNSVYQYTHGAFGAKGAAGSFSNQDGSAGGTSSFVGPGVNLVLRGGKGGKGDGSAGGASAGLAGTSPLGVTLLVTAAGGGAHASAPADNGSASDLMDGGVAGAGNSSGGGGGSSPFAQGGQGGASGAVGNAPLLAFSGAGGGGAGAGDGTTRLAAGDGADGFLRITRES